MEKLRGMGMIVGVVFVMLSTVGCKKEVILDPQNVVVADTVEKVASAVKHVIQVQNPGNNKDIQPNIQIAVNKAVDGDTIKLPEGNFIFNGTITITKLVSLKGKGLAKTILYRPESTSDAALNNQSMFYFRIDKDISSNIIVRDLCFKSKIPCKVSGDGGSLASDVGIKFYNCVDFIVTKCRFEYFDHGAIAVAHKDNLAGGLICDNYFYKCYKLGQLGYGVVVSGENKKWISDPKFGSSNFIFVEHNYFEGCRHSIAGGGCALYVFRHNTVYDNYVSHAIDSHEARGDNSSNHFSTRAIEAYEDTIINRKFKDGTTIVPNQSAYKLFEDAIGIRGGEALIHDNYVEGYRRVVGLFAFDKSKWPLLGTTYPILSQIGYLSGINYSVNGANNKSDSGDGDVFIWGNNLKPYDTDLDTLVIGLIYNFNPDYLKENRDYHLVAKSGYKTYPYPHPLKSKIK
jgi:hypothetical protein